MMDEYSKPEVAEAVRAIVAYAQQHGDSYAYRWAVAKKDRASAEHNDALKLDEYRRNWTFFYNRFLLFRESGMFDLRGPFDFRSANKAESFFPGQFRASTFIRFVEPLEHANCVIVLEKPSGECADEERKVFRFLRTQVYPTLGENPSEEAQAAITYTESRLRGSEPRLCGSNTARGLKSLQTAPC